MLPYNPIPTVPPTCDIPNESHCAQRNRHKGPHSMNLFYRYTWSARLTRPDHFRFLDLLGEICDNTYTILLRCSEISRKTYAQFQDWIWRAFCGGGIQLAPRGVPKILRSRFYAHAARCREALYEYFRGTQRSITVGHNAILG